MPKGGITTPLPVEKFDRLPKAVQSYIRDLERELRTTNIYVDELLNAVDGSVEKTDTIADPYADNYGPSRRSLYLPNGTTIEFNLDVEGQPRGRSIMANLTDRRLKDRKVLEIQGDSGLQVIMNSSNSFYIAFPERWGS